MRGPPILLFIPGNPGLVEYYTRFFEALRSHHPKLQVHAFNHIGFSTNGRETHKLPRHQIELDAQIAHAIDRLDNLVLANKAQSPQTRGKIFLAGHSVGAYIACQVLAARSQEIERIYLLTPTLTQIAQSPQGLILSRCLYLPGLAHVVGGFVWLLTTCLPASTRRALVTRFTGFSEEAVRVTADSVVQPVNVYSALTLAASEMRDIAEPDAAFWHAYGSRCSAYWVEHDHWTHLDSRDQLLAETKMESFFCKEANHAFCIRHSETVAQVVAGWLRRDLAKSD